MSYRIDWLQGSSPLTRGKQRVDGTRRFRRGLIPAHAGKTFRRRGSGPPPRAHPRSRGENSRPPGRASRPAGSSPLTRGKPERRGRWQCRDGLIPAHAGKTGRRRCRVLRSPAHPRSRGENPKPVAPPEPGWGSSPLTRGKQVEARAQARDNGLIPAHAGKTRPESRRPIGSRAHPRSRGENGRRDPNGGRLAGSSPLTRGKLEGVRVAARDRGLIPAHAGKTVGGALRLVVPGAHPRSRGENTRSWSDVTTLAGSSPLTRGKRAWGTEST